MSEILHHVAADTVVSIYFRILDPDGVVIDTTDGKPPATFLCGAGNVVPALEEGLVGKSPGDSVRLEVPDAYGEHDPRGVQVIPRDGFPPEIELRPGLQFQAEGSDGRPVRVWVAAVEGEDVTVDLNHPLAGMTVTFEVTVVGVRAATPAELADGHPADAPAE